MNILMCTNTFTPHVGGVAKSVATFADYFLECGHAVLTIAPEFPDAQEDEHVKRVPAIQNYNGSDFSVQVPLPFFLTGILDEFKPDIVHSHHPFLLGDTAQRISASRGIPLVFTHHTMYEQYTHYVPGDSPIMQQYVIDLATGYANLCDFVVAPSESVAEILRERGVTTPIEAIPTGIDTDKFSKGNRIDFRNRNSIPLDATVIGHVGRLAPEKNLDFLSLAVSSCLHGQTNTHFLVIGDGPSTETIQKCFDEQGLSNRLHLVGKKMGSDLIDGYHAMDVFAFTSKSETQGMVLAEAMAAGVPVVALDAPGVREIVSSDRNGKLIQFENITEFSNALNSILNQSEEGLDALRSNAIETSIEFSVENCANRTLAVYQTLLAESPKDKSQQDPWESTLRYLEREWKLIANKTVSLGSAIIETESETMKS